MKTSQVLFNEMEDESLARQASAGSREAFGELVSRHHQIVRTMLWRVLGDESEVEDVAQEVFISALSSVSRFQQQSTFRTWLLSIARNKAITHLRKKRTQLNKRTSNFDQWMFQQQVASIAEDQEPTNELIALENCIGQLSANHQRLVKAIYFEGHTAVEFAHETGEAKNTVRMRLMRIRKALSVCIKKQT